MTTESLSPTSIRVTCVPPLVMDQNGPITSYNFSYTGEIFDTVTQFEAITIPNPIYPAVGPISVNITGLQEYNNYTISVRALNVQGSSSSSPQVVQLTDISGKIRVVLLNI